MKDYRILIDWLDANGNKINSSNSAVSATTKARVVEDGYKSKFKKILDYHMKHLAPTAADPEIKILQDNEFQYKEHHNTGAIENDYDHEVAVYMNKNGDWCISVYRNDTCVKADYGSSLDDLLKSLGKVMTLPAEDATEYKELLEWVDNKGNKISSVKAPYQLATNSQSAEVVYIWDMYMDPMDKGTWCSAEEYNGEYDGSVFKTKEAAFNEGKLHLYELEDEGELRGDPEDYNIDVIAIPKNKVSDYTLEFSGLK